MVLASCTAVLASCPQVLLRKALWGYAPVTSAGMRLGSMVAIRRQQHGTLLLATIRCMAGHASAATAGLTSCGSTSTSLGSTPGQLAALRMSSALSSGSMLAMLLPGLLLMSCERRGACVGDTVGPLAERHGDGSV